MAHLSRLLGFSSLLLVSHSPTHSPLSISNLGSPRVVFRILCRTACMCMCVCVCIYLRRVRVLPSVPTALAIRGRKSHLRILILIGLLATYHYGISRQNVKTCWLGLFLYHSVCLGCGVAIPDPGVDISHITAHNPGREAAQVSALILWRDRSEGQCRREKRKKNPSWINLSSAASCSPMPHASANQRPGPQHSE